MGTGIKMNIVMVGPFGLRLKGTMAVRALPMAKALAARGHAVEMILPPWDWPEDSGCSWEEDGVRVVNVALPPRIPVLRHMLVTWRMVLRALVHRPDVIHCFKPKAYAGLVAWTLWWLRKLGLVTARLVVDADDWEGAGGWNAIENYSWAQKRLFAWQEQWGLTHCDALTVASRTLESIVWSMGVPPARAFCVPNGVQNKQGTRGDMRGAKCILLYTRFFEFAVERVVEILRLVLTHVPQARLLVVGKGLFGEEGKLLALAEEVGLADRVNYVGWVRPEELPQYFATADVAIYPYDDTLINRAKCSVKLIDLMAAGLPIVADDVGQNSVYIEHGTSGFLVEPGDTAAFAGTVTRLLQDLSLRERLGEGAQQRVRQHFTWDRLVDNVEAAYRMAGRKASA
jgi:glycosyltransferase involved in cell wall biosynthesis